MGFFYTLRNRMQQNPAVTIGLLVLLVAAGLLYAWWGSGGPHIPPHPTHKAFFMDENTGEIMVKTTQDWAPLNNAQGQPTIFQAIFYTTDGGKTRKLAYLQKYSDEAKTALTKVERDPSAASDQDLQQKIKDGTYIRSPEKGAPWVLMSSPEATIISARAAQGTPSNAILQVAKPD